MRRQAKDLLAPLQILKGPVPIFVIDEYPPYFVFRDGRYVQVAPPSDPKEIFEGQELTFKLDCVAVEGCKASVETKE